MQSQQINNFSSLKNPVCGFENHNEPDAFTHKQKHISSLIEILSSSPDIAHKLATFELITDAAVNLYDTILKDKASRIEIWKARKIGTEEDLGRLELEESARINKKNSEAQHIIEEINACALSLLKICDQADSTELNQTLKADALKWLSLSHPQEKYTFKLELAISLLAQGRAKESLEVLSQLSQYFPQEMKGDFDALASGDPQPVCIEKFLRDHGEKILSVLRDKDLQESVPKTLYDILQQPSIVETLLKMVSIKELSVTQGSNEAVKASFPVDRMNLSARKIFASPSFSLKTAPINCRDTDDVAIIAMLRDGLEYPLLSQRLRNNPLIAKLAVLSVMRNNPRELDSLVEKFPENLKETIELFTSQITQLSSHNIQRKNLPLLDVSTRNYDRLMKVASFDEDICLLVVKTNGLALKEASAAMKNNINVVKSAIQRDVFSLRYASPEMRNNIEVVKLAVQKDGCALQYASPEMRNNIEVVKLAVKKDVFSLRYASPEMQNNIEVVKLAVQRTGFAIQCASPEMRNNIEVVKLAVQQTGDALQYASLEMRNNIEVVKLAVQQTGYALQCASPEMKNNIEVVKLAVQQTGYALQYASLEMRNNIEVVKLAVQKDGCALRYASSKMRNNLEVVKLAAQKDRNALRYADPKMQNNSEIVKLITEKTM